MRKASVQFIAIALAVAFWHGCTPACEPDAHEPNDSAGTYASLDSVRVNDAEQSWTATIAPGGDVDFFRIHAEEGTDTCIPMTPETCAFRVRLVPPQGADCRNYDLRLYDDGGTLIDSSSNGDCAEESITFTWDGMCGQDDSLYFRIEVRPQTGEYSCAPYTLYADMWEP